ICKNKAVLCKVNACLGKTIYIFRQKAKGAALGLPEKGFICSGLPLEATSPSVTNLAREMVSMISTQHAYTANAATVRTGDAMLGTLLDIKA
ncbi:flagellar basal body rod C-terminal domain-containing protein, partial [Desulfovibrio sp. 1188_IL3213]|uniref:flagellar basal body rod C-terminal domain-containing protein n=1 Tax=Desulfovibrio sp. 1188_IL3213 TaxID=3084052 RepID=UPI002FDB8CFC